MLHQDVLLVWRGAGLLLEQVAGQLPIQMAAVRKSEKDEIAMVLRADDSIAVATAREVAMCSAACTHDHLVGCYDLVFGDDGR